MEDVFKNNLVKRQLKNEQVGKSIAYYSLANNVLPERESAHLSSKIEEKKRDYFESIEEENQIIIREYFTILKSIEASNETLQKKNNGNDRFIEAEIRLRDAHIKLRESMNKEFLFNPEITNYLKYHDEHQKTYYPTNPNKN